MSAATRKTTDRRTAPLERVPADDRRRVEAMRYPAVAPDESVFDLALPLHGPDPFYDPCPSWCQEAASGHQHVESCDEDRVHFGPRLVVPVRSVRADLEFDNDEPDNDVVLVGTADMYLRRPVAHREPTVWLGRGDTREGFELTCVEAEEIGRTLLQLAAAGRSL